MVWGMSPYRLIYGKSCHLPVEMEYSAFGAIKNVNFNLPAAGEKRKLDLDKLEELRNEAYENSRLYKDKVKALHDKMILRKTFKPNQKVLLYNARLHLFPRKLKTRWSGPFTVTKVFENGAVEIEDPSCGYITKFSSYRRFVTVYYAFEYQNKPYSGERTLGGIDPDDEPHFQNHTFPVMVDTTDPSE